MTIRSLSRSAAAALVGAALLLPAALGADEPPAASDAEKPAAHADETAAQPAPPQAEPVTAPVMPTTVLTPSGVESEAPSAGKASAATAAPAAPAAEAAAAKPAEASRFQHSTRPGGERRAVELGGPRTPESRWHGYPISLSLRDAPLPEVLRSFARLAGMNLVLDPKVQGTVTVELHDVPWDQALYVILKTHGLAAEIDGRVWVVEPQ